MEETPKSKLDSRETNLVDLVTSADSPVEDSPTETEQLIPKIPKKTQILAPAFGDHKVLTAINWTRGGLALVCSYTIPFFFFGTLTAFHTFGFMLLPGNTAHFAAWQIAWTFIFYGNQVAIQALVGAFIGISIFICARRMTTLRNAFTFGFLGTLLFGLISGTVFCRPWLTKYTTQAEYIQALMNSILDGIFGRYVTHALLGFFIALGVLVFLCIRSERRSLEETTTKFLAPNEDALQQD